VRNHSIETSLLRSRGDVENDGNYVTECENIKFKRLSRSWTINEMIPDNLFFVKPTTKEKPGLELGPAGV
jgi:hypothetical protein